MNPVKIFRQMLTDNEVIVAPGVYDCVSAKIAEKLGFPAVYMGSFITNAAVYPLWRSSLYDHPGSCGDGLSASRLPLGCACLRILCRKGVYAGVERDRVGSSVLQTG